MDNNPKFFQRFVSELPGDGRPGEVHPAPRQVDNAFYSFVQPAPVRLPKLMAWSEELAHDFNLIKPESGSNFLARLAGNLTEANEPTFATCYGGHQFGHWAGQLGDGRVIFLGELKNQKNELWEVQLKGAGPTPFSRRGDGRAVLRSSLREYLASEAMYYLGIPTTRALALIGTGDQVLRDMFYDGNPAHESGAIVVRMAPTFVRFGHFEICAARNNTALLTQLLRWTAKHHYPEFSLEQNPEALAVQLFQKVCQLTARMVVDWMRVGFVHGVMNTDNMSILGLTIDYGPFAWTDVYDHAFTPNTTDLPGRRYAYGQQAAVAQWNLGRLAESFSILGEATVDDLKEGLNTFRADLHRGYLKMMANKLGLSQVRPEDTRLFQDLEKTLQMVEVDMTIFFRQLAKIPVSSERLDVSSALVTLQPAFYDEISDATRAQWSIWLEAYGSRLQADQSSRTEQVERMNTVNPKYILRNYMAVEAIDALEAGDPTRLQSLMNLLQRPYDEQPAQEKWFVRRPEWARHRPGSSALSCSS